jgi:hypothetical protein
LFSLDLRELAKVTVTPQKVEGVEHETVLPFPGEFGLQF